jgi:hypothetical protein
MLTEYKQHTSKNQGVSGKNMEGSEMVAMLWGIKQL